MDWRKITDEKERYAAYLCSREWAEKREAVRERAGGKCERCRVLQMDACHHLTYARKYDEALEDLQAICNPCHEFTHGKSGFDPAGCASWIRYLGISRDKCGLPPVPFIVVDSGMAWDPEHDAAMCAIKTVLSLKNAADVAESHACISTDALTSYADGFLRSANAIERDVLGFAFIQWIISERPKVELKDYEPSLRAVSKK